jgi:hypothetical protein
MVFRLLDLALAIALSLTIANVAQVRAPEPPRVRDSAALWRDTTLSPDFPLIQLGARHHWLAPQSDATF